MISIYWPLGYPTLEASVQRCTEAIEAGADWLELGIPYSDPAADGPVVEAATAQALANGVTVADCLAAAKQIHEAHPDVPLIAMTYANIAYQMGWEQWATALNAAGMSGCILPDVPLEESAPLRAALDAQKLTWHPLVTPVTNPTRVEAICKSATGFVYVSSSGITGVQGPGDVSELVAAVRKHGDAAVGFGIQTKAQVAAVEALGAHAIIGSEAIRNEANLGAYVRGLL